MNKQHGFIQGALLIGIALLAVVIGAFAMASNNNTTDTSKEKTKTKAALAVKKMADSFESYQIKAAQVSLAAADSQFGPNPTISGVPKEMVPFYGIYNGVPGQDNAFMSFTMANTAEGKAICAYVNRVIGLTTSADDDAAITAGNDAPASSERCVHNTADHYEYFRAFRGTPSPDVFSGSGSNVPSA